MQLLLCTTCIKVIFCKKNHIDIISTGLSTQPLIELQLIVLVEIPCSFLPLLYKTHC